MRRGRRIITDACGAEQRVERKTMETKENSRRPVWMLVASMLIFGSIGIFRRAIPVSSAFLAFSRGMLGGAFLLAFMKLRRQPAAERLPARDAVRLAVTGAVMGVNWMLLFEAYNYTTVAVATLCYYMEPAIVILLSAWIFRERITAKKAVCAAIAVVGMVLVSGAAGGPDARAGSARGILLGLAAAVCYSAVVIMNKRIRGVDAFRKTAIQLLSAGAVMIPYLLATGGSAGTFSPSAVLLLLVVGFVHTGVAYLLYFGSMDALKAQSVAILSYVDPVAALLLSAVFLKEPLSLSGAVGALLIIGSAVVSELRAGE